MASVLELSNSTTSDLSQAEGFSVSKLRVDFLQSAEQKAANSLGRLPPTAHRRAGRKNLSRFLIRPREHVAQMPQFLVDLSQSGDCAGNLSPQDLAVAFPQPANVRSQRGER